MHKPDFKQCSRCREVMSLDAFGARTNAKDGRQHYCKLCRAEYNQKWYQENQERVLASEREKYKQNPEHQRRLTLKSKFGITPAEYEVFSNNQGGVCALCGQLERARHQNGSVRRLAVDHDHATGHVRGLLCFACNVHVGYIEKLVGLTGLIAYLDRLKVVV